MNDLELLGKKIDRLCAVVSEAQEDMGRAAIGHIRSETVRNICGSVLFLALAFLLVAVGIFFLGV